MKHSTRAWRWSGLFLLLVMSLSPARLSYAEPLDDTAAPTSDYKIGSGDVLDVTVADAPEFGGKFRVSDSGVIAIAGLGATVDATGRTPIELAHAIRQQMFDAGQLRDPKVNVFIEEYHGRTVTVLGNVTKPGVYPLQRKTNVVEAISLAGGLLPNAGNTVTIVRGRASAEATGTAVGSVEILNLNGLITGKDLAANVEVQNGDVINVSSSDLVYVVGAVIKPGGFVLPDPSSGMSVVQAVSMAQGFTNIAATHRGLIIRQSTSDAGRQMVTVDIAQMMEGKETDVRLAPNDILFVPESGARKTLKVMGEVAMAAVNGVAIYGLGYRVAGGAP
jgi:polysaccharide biosynthesis/export protein